MSVCSVLMRLIAFAMIPYFAAHYLDDDFNRKNFILQAVSFPEDHTSANINEKYEAACDDWKISRSRRHILVADGARNMQNGLCTSVDCVHCAIHNLQLCIRVRWSWVYCRGQAHSAVSVCLPVGNFLTN